MNEIDIKKYEMNEKDFRRGKMTRKGDYSDFFSYTYLPTGANYTVEIPRKINQKSDTERMYNKIKMHIFLNNHPCFIRLLGYFIIKKKAKKDAPAIVVELCSNGTLHSILQKERNGEIDCYLNATRKLIIIYGVAVGMAYLHSCNIIHRDLKTDNILLDDYLRPLITDFGCSKITDDIKISQTVQQTIAVIMAPEFIENYEKFIHTKPIDVYSFAIFLYEIVLNEEPFPGASPLEIVDKVMKRERPEFTKPIPKCYQNLIERCWSHEPEKRPTFDQIVHELETNEEFITDEVCQSDFYKYVEYVKNLESVSCDSDENHEKVSVQGVVHKELKVDVKPIDLNQFEKRNRIGEGGFGKVYKVFNKETGEIDACKISKSPIDIIEDNAILNIERELNIISKMNSPLIVKFIGYSPMNFKKVPRPTIITEFMSNGSLDILIDLERKGLSVSEWNDTKKLINIYGIARGMSYLHSHEILHRDLKPGNIFVDDYLFPKIGGFETSKELSNDQRYKKYKEGICGTYEYMSPEIMLNNEYTKSGDVYAFGMTVYEIITNEEIYKGWQLIQIILDVSKGYRPPIPPNTPRCYQELIERCWKQDPKERPSFNDIVEKLKNDSDFITDTIESNEFYDYVDYIDQLSNNEESESINPTFKKVQLI